MFEGYNNCLFNNTIILKSRQRFNSDHHVVITKCLFNGKIISQKSKNDCSELFTK